MNTTTDEITEYPYRIIERVLFNFPDIEEAVEEVDLGTAYGQLLIAIKCDMELAYDKLPPAYRADLASIFLKGEDAITTCVPTERLHRIVERLYWILNIEGLGDWLAPDILLCERIEHLRETATVGNQHIRQVHHG